MPKRYRTQWVLLAVALHQSEKLSGGGHGFAAEPEGQPGNDFGNNELPFRPFFLVVHNSSSVVHFRWAPGRRKKKDRDDDLSWIMLFSVQECLQLHHAPLGVEEIFVQHHDNVSASPQTTRDFCGVGFSQSDGFVCVNVHEGAKTKPLQHPKQRPDELGF